MSSTLRVGAGDIEAALQARLAPDFLEVRDDSAQHAGHAGARSGGHFLVRIRCRQFASLSRLARHRLVYDALADLIPQGIHALAIEADLPDGTVQP